MKTIAISIDEASLVALDRMARALRSETGPPRKNNRSAVVRRALQEFLARQKRHEREGGDRKILAAHRKRLEREAEALVAEQALL